MGRAGDERDPTARYGAPPYDRPPGALEVDGRAPPEAAAGVPFGRAPRLPGPSAARTPGGA